MGTVKWDRFLHVPGRDASEGRRGYLLNVLMLLVGVLGAASIMAVWLFRLSGNYHPQLSPLIQIASASLIAASLILYLVNRFGSTRVAGLGFVGILIAVLALADEPYQVAAGRGLLYMALPIVLAGIVLPPAYTFLATAAVIGVDVMLLAAAGSMVTPFPWFAYIVIAFVTWLSGRAIEQALADLHTLNRELDGRVSERTAELAAANRRLVELDQLKDRFLSTVSHELRTPLGAIIGYADLLAAGGAGDMSVVQHEYMRRILANGRRQQALVNDLLDRAQIEAGSLSLKYDAVSVAEMVDGVRATMEGLAAGKGLELHCTVQPEMPTICGDAQRLQQIAINLLTNAIKFTEQGQVTLTAGQADDTHWFLRVSDTGPGIPVEARSFIFEPFRRVDNSATRRQGGAGLGLSIVRHLVELMGGQVELESEIGRGSIFTVTLPIRQEKDG